MKQYDIKDISFADRGKLRIDWAEREMPVLRLIKKRFEKEKPLKGIRLGACLHVTSETANLMKTLKSGGAETFLCASNPLSTQDDVAASLVKHEKIPVFAIKGEDSKTYFSHLSSVLSAKPQITMDDGADLVAQLHKLQINNNVETHDRASHAKDLLSQAEIKNQAHVLRQGETRGSRVSTSKYYIKNKKESWEFFGSSEETTTGVIRLKAMEKDGALKIPVVAVNDSDTKHLFDNRFGTGQSTIDGLLRATNILIAGKIICIVGFGFCGRGLADRARGMGARVIVCEADSVKALEAVMMGFEVATIMDAVKVADVVITVTGNKHVIDVHHFEAAKDGIIFANSGHFNVEINLEALAKMSKSKRKVREYVEEYVVGTKKIYILGEGRLLNLAAAEGHPASVMDMSFANQALSAEWIFKNRGKLSPKVYRLPVEMDREIAELKLKAMGVSHDALTAEQKKYLESWKEGT